MTISSATRAGASPRRRWLLWIGLVLLQLLLMGSAFVGGRMLAGQNQRGSRAGAAQLPSQLPRESPAATGAVQRIQGQVLTLGRGFGGPGGSNANNATEVAVTADTKYYKNTPSNSPQPGGGQPQFRADPATFEDVKVGANILVWGTRNGQRITADVVYVQNAGR